MAWRIFKKIKDGFKKVIGGIKKGAQWLGNNVLKPIVKPIVNAAAPVVDKFLPGVGTAVKTGVDALSDITAGKNNIVGGNGHGIRINNPKIKMRGYG